MRSEYRKAQKFVTCKIYYPFVYKTAARSPVNEKKVLFIETTASSISSNYQILWNKLNQYDYDLQLVCLEKGKVGNYELNRRYADLMRQAADAKYIFLNDACVAFGHVKLRKETKAVNTWHACGAFKKFGFGTADLKFGENAEMQKKYPNYTYLDEIYVSSPEVVDKYAYSTGLRENQVIPLGTGRTDLFFDGNFKKKAKEKFEFLCPIAKDKKVILYAPTFRGTIKGAKAPNALSVPMLQEALSDEYILVIKQHPVVKKQIPLLKKEQEFAVNFTKVMSSEELMCVADILISDYSSVVFEYSLFEKPMIFFAYDKEDYDDWRGFYYDYEEMTPGPVFTKNKEIIDYIKHVDERFNKQEVIDFKNKFMASCDGHVTERIIEQVFGSLGEKKERKENTKDTQEEELLLMPKEEVKEILLQEYPDLATKTSIAYVYQKNGIESYPHIDPHIDWNILHEELPDDYAVIYSGNTPPFTCSMFHKKPETISNEDLINAADIVIVNGKINHALLKENTYLYIPDYKFSCRNEKEYFKLKKGTEDFFFEDTLSLTQKIKDGKGDTPKPDKLLSVL